MQPYSLLRFGRKRTDGAEPLANTDSGHQSARFVQQEQFLPNRADNER
jgi:hypothetical protein